MEPWWLIVYLATKAHNEVTETRNGAEKAHSGSFEDLGLKVADSCDFEDNEDPHKSERSDPDLHKNAKTDRIRIRIK